MTHPHLGLGGRSRGPVLRSLTGTRIGEALAVLWSQVDLDRGEVQVTIHPDPADGSGPGAQGNQEQGRGEGAAVAADRDGDVASAVGGGRQVGSAGVPRQHRWLPRPLQPAPVHPQGARRGRTEFGWITSHHFRKTTATILDEAALSARQVADQLGHTRPSMTQDVYMSRRVASSRAAEALEQALRDPDQEENRGQSVGWPRRAAPGSGQGCR
jgi:integrase